MKLPNSWKYKSLKDIIKDTQLGVNVKSSVDTEGIPLLKMGNLTIGDFNFNKLENTCEIIENIENYYLEYGDFLFNTRNTPELVGKSAVWKWNDRKIIFNSNIMRINFIENIDSFFLGYYFSSKQGWNKLKLISTGTTSVGAIYTKDLLKVKVPLPPIEEQKQIADILSTVDKKIAFVEKNINTTEELKKGLMQKLLTEGIGHTEFKDSELGRIPKSWEISNIENIFNIFVGRDLKEDRFSKEKTDTHIFPVFSNTVDNNGFYGYYDYEEFNGSSLTVVGRGIGVGTAFTKNGSYGAIGRLLVLFPQKGIKPHFYTEYINFKIKIFSESSGIPQLTGAQIKNYKCPIPPLEEQKQIAEILSTVDKKLENLKEKKQSFEELKKGLMQKLLTGEVRV